jgi:hypothetical protein
MASDADKKVQTGALLDTLAPISGYCFMCSSSQTPNNHRIAVMAEWDLLLTVEQMKQLGNLCKPAGAPTL